MTSLVDAISLPIHLQRMVDEEELQFHEEYMNEQDPSILHFLLASGDDVCLRLYLTDMSITIRLLLERFLFLNG